MTQEEYFDKVHYMIADVVNKSIDLAKAENIDYTSVISVTSSNMIGAVVSMLKIKFTDEMTVKRIICAMLNVTMKNDNNVN